MNNYQPMYNAYAAPYAYGSPQPYGAYPRAAELPAVKGIEGARSYPLGPNSAIALFDMDSDVFYVKRTDAGGYATVSAFDFSPHEAPQAPAAEPQQPDLSGYVPRSEFDELVAKVNAIAAPKTRARKAASDGE